MPQPTSPQQASVPGAQPQAPFGSTPAMGPTQNKGMEAAGLQKLGSVVKQLEEMVPMFGSSSEQGKAVLDALNKLAKHVPAGSVTPASERNNIEQMAMRNAQQSQTMKQLQPGAGAGGGMPGAEAA